MKLIIAALILAFSVPAMAQLPDVPEPRSGKKIVVANIVMYGSSVLGAHATAFGSNQCLREDTKAGKLAEFGLTAYAGGRFHPWRRSFAMSLPADGAVSLSSWLLHRKRHDLLAVLLPAASASLQTGIASMQYANGCF